MGTLRDFFTKLSGNTKSPFEYELYKYEDIQSKWIIHQGHLQYLYNTTFLGISFFKTYLVVLARIPIKNMEDLIGLYLYSDEKKSLSYFFSIDRKTIINDRCNKIIKPEPKYFLMELKFIDNDKPEIFGAKDNSERLIWVEKFKNIFSKSQPTTPISNHPYLLPIDEKKFRYEPANPFIPEQNLNYSRTQSDSELLHYSIAEPIDYSRSIINKTNENSSSCIQLSSNDDDSYLSQETIFLWNEIFYSNENDDYKNILTKIGICGTFLIRPQSKKTSSNDHDYTLCMYYGLNNIRCFGIHQLPTRENQYSLSKKGSKTFVDMIQLCQYYTNNPLPMSINNVYLKKPYKYYKN